jgi:Leucine-rich repeat (LRR) protein
MDNILFKEILCSKCGNIPIILKAHTDNGKIELECKKCGIYEILIDDYLDELSENNYFKKCNHCECKDINKIYYYCFNCKKDFCENCKNNYHSGHESIEVDQKKKVCIKHKREFKYYCYDDQENFCEEEKEVEHKGHEIKEISAFEKDCFINYCKNNSLGEINEELNKLVKFNDLILKNIEIFKDNKLYINSIKNMGESLKEGNKRNSKDIKFLLKEYSQSMEISNKAIEALKNKEKLHKIDKNVYLWNKDLVDQDFKYLCQIRFNQLKELDISENKITNIEPFNRMSLPFLEFLNLSDNQIELIEPVTKINSKNLHYIFLQKNQIKDIDAFLDSNFQSLKILRVEDNVNLKYKNDEDIEKVLNKINEKYPGKFIYKSIDEQKDDFKEKYKYAISWDTEIIDLSDFNGGDEMLKNLFLIITYEHKNIIKKLLLRNNKITDPSMLNKVNFNLLERLDLSVNLITDLKFLLDMKAKDLEILYLDNNKFMDFSPLLRDNFPNLKVLSLNKNSGDYKNIEENPAYIELKNKTDQNGNKLEIQFGSFEEHLKQILNGNNSQNEN